MGRLLIKKVVKSNRLLYGFYRKIIGDKMENRRIELATKELQSNGKSIIETLEAVLDFHHIKYFINFGSLLGLIRDGKFMPYDHDIDFGILIKKGFNWARLEKAVVSCGGKKIKQFTLDGMITEQSYRFGHLDIDFFICNLMDTESIQYLYYKDPEIVYPSEAEYSVGEFHAVEIKGLKKIKIHNINFIVPQNYEEYLESIYSENWRTPDPNWSHLTGSCLKMIPNKYGHATFFV